MGDDGPQLETRKRENEDPRMFLIYRKGDNKAHSYLDYHANY